MRVKLIIFSISLLFISCGKNSTVEGIVLEENYETPIPNAEVIISESHHNNDDPQIASTQTDASGHFKIEYKQRKLGYSYFLKVWSTKAMNSKKEGINSKDASHTIHLMPLTFVNLSIKNNLPYDIFISGMIKLKSQEDTLIKNYTAINGSGNSEITWSYRKDESGSLWITDRDIITINKRTDTLAYHVIIK